MKVIGKAIFLNTPCYVLLTYYSNSRPGLQLYDSQTRELFTTASVDVPYAEIPGDSILIKDCSENRGVLKSLVDSGILYYSGKSLEIHSEELFLCYFSKEVLDEIQQEI